ncbi:inner membrane protein [Gammaproteobacteria bacterium]
MDTLTHALSGALLARATEGRHPSPDRLPRGVRMWAGFFAAAFPDSDVITRFIDPLTYLSAHRGITHSVVLLPLWALGLAFTFSWVYRRKYSWRTFVGVCALGIGIHIARDVITAFGTMILAPFSYWRVRIPTTFIIDPYFTAIILGGLIASAWWKNTRLPAVLGLTVLISYVGFQDILRHHAVGVGEEYAARHGLDVGPVEAIPQPFSPFHWMVVLTRRDAYYLTYVSLSRRDIPAIPPVDASWARRVIASYFQVEDAIWKRVPSFGSGDDINLVEQAWNSETLAPYRRFAMFPALYRVDHEKAGDCVWFNDLRFAMAGRAIPFRYGVCRDGADTAWRVYRLSTDENGREISHSIPR